MTEQRWQNSQTGIEIGVNTVLGSPRAWITRAVGSRNLDIQESSLHPNQITVAGIWARPMQAFDTGSQSAIYRYFELPLDFYTQSRSRSMRSMIGVAVATAADQILATRSRMTAAGAEWTWWAWPAETRTSYYTPVATRTVIDHPHLYALFDQGLTAAEVAQLQGLSITSVKYVHEKWQSGRPAQVRPARPCLNHQAIVDDLRSGAYGMKEIADRNGTTRTTVWRIRREQGIPV